MGAEARGQWVGQANLRRPCFVFGGSIRPQTKPRRTQTSDSGLSSCTWRRWRAIASQIRSPVAARSSRSSLWRSGAALLSPDGLHKCAHLIRVQHGEGVRKIGPVHPLVGLARRRSSFALAR